MQAQRIKGRNCGEGGLDKFWELASLGREKERKKEGR